MSVHSVHLSSSHKFSKQTQSSITLVRDHGVEGDGHARRTVKHLYNLKRHAREQEKAQREDPTAIIPVPRNREQVHLIQSELFEDDGFRQDGEGSGVEAGDLGENITTAGLDLVEMSKGTRLTFVGPSTMKARDETGDRLCSPANALKSRLTSSATSEPEIEPHQDASSALLRLSQTCATWLAIRHYPLPSLLLLIIYLVLNAWLQDYQSNTRNDHVSDENCNSHTPPSATAPSIILTGLRNLCSRIDDYKPGLMAHCYIKDEDGKTIGVKVGVTAVIERGGVVQAGMKILVDEPDDFVKMERI